MKKIYGFTAIVLLCVLTLLSCSYESDLPRLSADTKNSVISTKAETAEPTISSVQSSLPENSSLEVRFIDVGQADSSLVLCDGKAMLIDGGNAEDSNLIAAYLKKKNA